MSVQWSGLWIELQRNLQKQPRCPQHPHYPCVKTLAPGMINDIVEVSADQIKVRSYRTGKDDYIESSEFEDWWNHLTKYSHASLAPGHSDNPHPYHARIVGAITVSCLPHLIKRDDNDKSVIRLTGNS